MGIQVLGPLTVDGKDGIGPRDRVVLEALVVRGGAAVTKEALADALYGETMPPSWPKVVQGCIARLRRLLGAATIETSSHGYRLVVHDDELDARRFETLLRRAHEHLADHDPDRAAYAVNEALGLWRGKALTDLEEWQPGQVEAARLEGLRMDAQELRVAAEIASGRARECLEEARALVKEAPFREHRWCLHARALYQSGRQTEALEVLRRARRMLLDEHGLDPGAELLTLEQAILRQDPELSVTEPVMPSVVCPYRGLLPYEADDAESFFGRDADVAACLKRLRDAGVLVVVGPSGAGKSSVVRAGVVAALRSQGVDVVVTTPGAHPLDSLAGLPRHGSMPVLLIDQAEEAVTLCADTEERAAYFERLGSYAGPLVLALRADRMGDLSGYPTFARLVERGLYLLTTMGEDDLRSVVEGPARQAGLRLEAGLVDLLVREVRGEPGALPLLSHVLRQTWEHREGATLTVEGYRRTGGIRHAVAQSAEGLYERLDDRERSQLRAMLLRLITIEGDGEATRARVARDKLAVDESHERLVETLVNGRLLSSDDGDVQIAHEALAREWPRLRDWLQEDVEGRRTFKHLAAAAEAWEGMGRPESELYRGARLAGAVEWADRHSAELTSGERDFLTASRERAEREQNTARDQLRAQRRSNRRLRQSLVGIAVLLVAALVAGSVAVSAERRARREATAADAAARGPATPPRGAPAHRTPAPDPCRRHGVESIRRDDSLASRSTLYSVLQKSSQVIGVTRGPGPLESVDISPDGRTVAVASAHGGGVLTYDAATLRQSGVRKDLGASAARFTPDGRRVLVGAMLVGADGVNTAGGLPPLQLLEASSLRTVASFRGIRGRTHIDDGLDISADGRRVAAVAWDDARSLPVEALVWDLAHPARPILRVPMPGIFSAIKLGPRGDVLYVAQRDKDIRAIEVATGRVLATAAPRFAGERSPALALSADGATLATSDADGIAVRAAGDLRTHFLLSGATDAVTSLAFSRDGTRLAAGHADGTAVVWDLAKRKPVDTLKGHNQEVEGLGFSPDGSTLYTASWDHQLLAWDLVGSRGFPPWRRYPTNPRSRNPHAAIPSPDGRRIAYLAYGSPRNELTFRDLASGRLTRTRLLPQISPPAPIGAWSPDSSMFITGGGTTLVPSAGVTHTYVLQRWDPVSGALVRESLDTGALRAEFAKNGDLLVVTRVPSLQRIDAHTLQPVGDPVDLRPSVGDFRFIYETADRKKVILAVGDSPREVQIVDLERGTTRRMSMEANVFWMAPSPDGTRMVVYDNEEKWGVLRTESLLEGSPRWVLPPRPFPGNVPWDFAWSADGHEIVTTGTGVVELWQADTLARLGSLYAGNQDDVPTVGILKGDPSLMIAHPHGDVLTWDLRPQHVVDLACSLAGRNFTEQEWKKFVGDRPYRKTCSAASIAGGLRP